MKAYSSFENWWINGCSKVYSLEFHAVDLKPIELARLAWQAATESLEIAHEVNEMPSEKELLKVISDNPALSSLLYDVDLMPEQVTGTKHWVTMLIVSAAFKLGQETSNE